MICFIFFLFKYNLVALVCFFLSFPFVCCFAILCVCIIPQSISQFITRPFIYRFLIITAIRLCHFHWNVKSEERGRERKNPMNLLSDLLSAYMRPYLLFFCWVCVCVQMALDLTLCWQLHTIASSIPIFASSHSTIHSLIHSCRRFDTSRHSSKVNSSSLMHSLLS